MVSFDVRMPASYGHWYNISNVFEGDEKSPLPWRFEIIPLPKVAVVVHGVYKGPSNEAISTKLTYLWDLFILELFLYCRPDL